MKNTSAILFISMALIAALLANKRVSQKLISKYEHTPTPSQPKNNCKKLPALINTNIKKVNNDKYDKNFMRLGSCII